MSKKFEKKILEIFFSAKTFCEKFFWVKKILGKKIWKIFLKIVEFLCKYWFFLWKSSIFPFFENAPKVVLVLQKKPLQVFGPPLAEGPPYSIYDKNNTVKIHFWASTWHQNICSGRFSWILTPIFVLEVGRGFPLCEAKCPRK